MILDDEEDGDLFIGSKQTTTGQTWATIFISERALCIN